MMAQHKWHKEIKAWADGAEIELKKDDGSWVITDPSWYEGFEYRIKQTPKEPKYLYAYYDVKGRLQFDDAMYPPTIYFAKITRLEI